jgi:uncharacterized protein YkwD
VRGTLLLAGLIALGGCRGDPPAPASSTATRADVTLAAPPGGAPSADPGDPALDPAHEDVRAYCVAETNRYRARAGAAPLARSPALEAYAAAAARVDGRAHAAHTYTRGPHGPRVAFAENAVVRWPLARYGSLRQVVAAALQAFWAEGPGGPHYENMRGNWQVVGCGLAVDDGQVTLVQHFR